MGHDMHSMKIEFEKLEDAYKDMAKELELTTKRYLEEKNSASELRSQLKWHQQKAMEDSGNLQMMMNDCKDKLHKVQAENTQMEQDKGRLEKMIYDLETQLQDKELSSSEEIRELENESDELREELERQRSETAERSRQFYQYMNTVQQEVKQWSNVADGLREQYASLAVDIHDTHTAVQNLQNFEDLQMETVYNEIKSVIDHANSFIVNNEKMMDFSQDLEVALEEERSRSIMLEERSSRLEQQVKEIQRRAESSERRTEERFNIEIERIRSELAHSKSENIKLAEALKSSQQKEVAAQMGKRDSEEREKVLHGQVRSLTETIKRLQKQLEQTKNLLKMVQDERESINDESENLRQELHSVLQGNTPRLSLNATQGGGSPVGNASSNYLSSFRDHRPSSASRASLHSSRPRSSATSNTPSPSRSSFSFNSTRRAEHGTLSSLGSPSNPPWGTQMLGPQSPREVQIGTGDSGNFKSHLFSKFESTSSACMSCGQLSLIPLSFIPQPTGKR